VGSNITLCVTSCDRHALLKETLDSFIRVNCGGGKPDRTIIIEDGPTPIPDWLKENIHYYGSNIGPVTWVNNEQRQGQIYSIDRMYAMVKTDYIFHTEDDWVFNLGNGWMIESKDILQKYPEIIQVSLRGNSGWHQLIDQPPYEGFKIAMPYWRGGWGGLSFNPGLRRLSDYKRLGSYGKYTTYGKAGLEHELLLSKFLLDRGYRIADLNRPIITHTGGACSKSAGYVPPTPKILIAIPVCRRFDYGKWESGDSEIFDVATAHEGKAYGTGIHISNRNNDRVSALRDTWLRDVAAFSSHVDYRLFYGRAGDSHAVQQDERDVVTFDLPDDYAHLPHKTVAVCAWAKARDYDFIFKADDDSYVWVDRLVLEILSNRQLDYGGFRHACVAGGGPGYWLSRKAFTIIADKADVNESWAEDVLVSKTLFRNSIQPVNLEGHRSGMSNHWFDISKVPDHSVCIHALQPQAMRDLYAREHAS
jgi:hypothetical protein